ncbi:MAG: MBL fold metallo-hydrolase [Thermogladius sp.]|nr:MBL fold metallo-hydrolase [Thermogladius sp.]
MEVTVLYDDLPSPNPGCIKGFGLSLLVQQGGFRLLFDAGSSPDVLLNNARVVGVELKSLNAVVVSHAHLDHTGGLRGLPARNIPVYVPYGQHRGLVSWLHSIGFENVVVVRDLQELGGGAYVMAYPESAISEQSLILESTSGSTMLVGCSHPGVHYMVGKAASRGFKVERVIGGLHLSDQPEYKVRSVVMELKRLGVRGLIPLHCSGGAALQYGRLLGLVREEPALCRSYSI